MPFSISEVVLYERFKPSLIPPILPNRLLSSLVSPSLRSQILNHIKSYSQMLIILHLPSVIALLIKPHHAYFFIYHPHKDHHPSTPAGKIFLLTSHKSTRCISISLHISIVILVLNIHGASSTERMAK